MKLTNFDIFSDSLSFLPLGKTLITTINAHSFNISHKDEYFKEALIHSDVLIPDGISIVLALRWLTGKKISKIAGADLFYHEMNELNRSSGKCFFLGSDENTLIRIKAKAALEFPHVKIMAFSPPYKKNFSEDDNKLMIESVNNFQPDVLFIGMTAPKQEKWAYQHLEKLNTGHVCCIGAVFDFYAGTVSRAPEWIISSGFEWFYRLLIEPNRMWKRYIIGNFLFCKSIFREKMYMKK